MNRLTEMNVRLHGASGIAFAVMGAMLIGAALLVVTGHGPAQVANEFLHRVVLRRSGVEESLVAMAPILLAALAAWIAARVGTWNIGIDGQVVAGAVAAGAVAPVLDAIPAVAMWMVVTCIGMAAGSLWAMLPAFLRTKSGINEIVTTIMMTYLAFMLASWLVKGPLQDESLVAPATTSVDISRRLPDLGDSRMHAGVAVVLIVTVIAWLLSKWTVVGILSRFVGESPAAATRIGLPTDRYIVVAFLLSGAVAALAGVSEVIAVRGSVQGDWRPSLGLAAFVALFLARRHVMGLIPSSLLLGMLAYASTVLPRSTDVAPAFFPMLEGILLILLAVQDWRRRPGVHASTTTLEPEHPR